MKKIFTLFSLFIGLSALAQTVPGLQIDSCHKARLIVAAANPVVTTFDLTGLNSTLRVYLGSCLDSARNRSVWFRFKTDSVLKMYRVAISGMDLSHSQLYKGSCDALEEVYCRQMGTQIWDNSDFYLLETNTEYKIRITRTTFTDPPLQVKVETIAPSRKVHSKVTGGLWHLPATWQEGRIPIVGDSVFITPGSRVTASSQYFSIRPTYLAYFQVGSDLPGSPPAILSATGSFSLSCKGNIEIGAGDSVIALASSSGSVFFQADKNLILNGVLATGNMKAALTFSGQGRQEFRGTGKILTKFSFLGVRNQTDTVHCHFPIHTNRLDLEKGVFNPLLAFRLANTAPTGISLDSTKGTIVRIHGRTTRKPVLGSYIQGGNNLHFPFLRYNKPATDNIPIDPIGPDSSIHVGNELLMDDPNQPMFGSISKEPGNAIIANRNVHFITSPFQNEPGRLIMRPQDTLHIHLYPEWSGFMNDSIGSFGNGIYQDTLTGLSDGVYMVDSAFEVYNGTSNLSFSQFEAAFSANGIQRAIYYRAKWPEPNRKAKGVKIFVQHIVQPPDGPVVLPLKAVGGRSMIRMRSNQTLPANGRLSFVVFSKDQILGNLRDLRLAQAPSPNGPWKVVSNAPRVALISKPLDLNSFAGLDLANGEYFCLATVANVNDAQAINIIAPPTWQMGCGQTLKTGLVIQNLGVVPISQVTVRITEPSSGQIAEENYTFNPPLRSLKADTAWVQYGPILDNFTSTTLRARILLPGDGNPANDSIQKTFNLGLKTLPFSEDFTTAQVYYLGDSSQANILIPPGWWVNTEHVWGSSYQFWEVRNGALMQLRESMLSIPLLAHSPSIQMPAGTYELKYSYLWQRIGGGSRPQVGDTLSLNLGSNCGQAYQEIDAINRDVHPNPPTTGWKPRVATFTKDNNDPAFLQVKLKLPFGLSGLVVAVDSIRLRQVSSVLPGQEAKLLVYPNPSREGFTIELPETGGELRLFDVLGRPHPIDFESIGNRKLRTRNPGLLPKGIYLLRWQKGEKMSQVRVQVAP